MADTILVIAALCVVLAVIYKLATQRTQFKVRVDAVVEADPDTCVQYFIQNPDSVVSKGHPYVLKMEILKRELTDEVFSTKTKLYESVPTIPFIPYRKDSIFNADSHFDIKKRVMTSHVDNSTPITKFFGMKVFFTWRFEPHPTRAGWTIIRDVIENDSSLGMRYLVGWHQTKAHSEIFREIQLHAPKYKKKA